MEEILASIRRIIADDDASKPPPAESASAQPPHPSAPPLPRAPVQPPPVRPAAAAPPPQPVTPPQPSMQQHEIDAMLARHDTSQDDASAEPGSDVLELTEAMTDAHSPRTEGFRTIDGQSDVIFEENSASEPGPFVPPIPDARRHAESGMERPLISSATTAAVDSAFNTLAQTVLVQNARTLEDLVREMLRPLLKTWLDDNLPGLVERLVRAEIERVSRGRG